MTFPHVLRRENTWGTPPQVLNSTSLMFQTFPKSQSPMKIYDGNRKYKIMKVDHDKNLIERNLQATLIVQDEDHFNEFEGPYALNLKEARLTKVTKTTQGPCTEENPYPHNTQKPSKSELRRKTKILVIKLKKE
jgi:hypothetical protein